MKKKVLVTALAATMVLSCVACGSSKNSTETTIESKNTDFEGTEIKETENEDDNYYLLATIESKADLALTEFPEYFGNDVESAIKEIVASGEVYVNNYQIPYVDEKGEFTDTNYCVNGEQALWQTEDGQWAWHAQKLYAYDMPLMGNLEEGFEAGATVDFEIATHLFTKYLSALEGQSVRLYAKEGEDYASRITTMSVDSAILCSVEGDDSAMVLIGSDGAPIPDAGGNKITVKAKNAPDYTVGETDIDCYIVYWKDKAYDDSWVVIPAGENHGTLIETDDDHNPLFQPAGSTDTTTIFECYIARSGVPEAFRHTQFIRGFRRIREYDISDEIIMWTLPDNDYLGTTGNGCIGFTRGDVARAALEFGITYAEDTVATTDTSTVNQETMDEYTSTLAAAKELLDNSDATNIQIDYMILELANTLGGTEGGMNPAGVIGIAAGLSSEISFPGQQ